MTIPNLHDHRAIEEIVARMDTGAIAQSLDKGGLSAFAREVVAAELTRRILVDVHDFRARSRIQSSWLLDRTLTFLPVVWYRIWLALCVGRLL
jgi:hypothetical protein